MHVDPSAMKERLFPSDYIDDYRPVAILVSIATLSPNADAVLRLMRVSSRFPCSASHKTRHNVRIDSGAYSMQRLSSCVFVDECFETARESFNMTTECNCPEKCSKSIFSKKLSFGLWPSNVYMVSEGT